MALRVTCRWLSRKQVAELMLEPRFAHSWLQYFLLFHIVSLDQPFKSQVNLSVFTTLNPLVRKHHSGTHMPLISTHLRAYHQIYSEMLLLLPTCLTQAKKVTIIITPMS